MDRLRLRFFEPHTVLEKPLTVRAARDVVHVWPLLLEGTPEARARCESFLSPAELERARRFYREIHRVAFVFAHGLMRYILAAYCNVPPATLQFTAGEFGKPTLNDTRVSFNLSHSHGRALLAVSEGRELGADVEQEDPKTNVMGIASSYFFGREFEQIRAAPDGRKTAEFFRFWVAKEAVLKAQGSGLSVPLDSFHVCADPGAMTAHVETQDPARLAKGWFVRWLECDEGWHAAVAADSTDWAVAVIERP